ncbi:MAG: hypothetical protein Q8P66_02320 [Candidatus Colwellbacteria bacterium]|nr:hypothetical protein [Candidatus Colwellbacteria bacterium]
MSISQRLREDQLGPTQEVLDWRFQVLLEARYPREDAWEIASELSVDLHEAADLVVKKGCPPEMAAAILL